MSNQARLGMQAHRKVSSLKTTLARGMMLEVLSDRCMTASIRATPPTYCHLCKRGAFFAVVPPTAKLQRSQHKLQRPTQLRRIGSVMYRVGKSATGSHTLQRTETPRRILTQAGALSPSSRMPSRPQVRQAGIC